MSQEQFHFDHELGLVSAEIAIPKMSTKNVHTSPTLYSQTEELSKLKVNSPQVNEPNSSTYGPVTLASISALSSEQTINSPKVIPIDVTPTGVKRTDSTTPLKPCLPVSGRPTHLSSVIYYWPNALAALAELNVQGNMQHYGNADNVQWVHKVSNKHIDKLLNHLIDHGTLDTDGIRHSTKVAWRALANLEDELIAAGAVPGRSRV